MDSSKEIREKKFVIGDEKKRKKKETFHEQCAFELQSSLSAWAFPLSFVQAGRR